MFGLPPDQIVAIANFVGIGLLGILSAFGLWWGQRRKPSSEKTLEVAGALVDSGSIKLLAAALEANNVEQAQNRHAAERGREVLHRLVDALSDLSKEIEEARREVRELGNTIRKH